MFGLFGLGTQELVVLGILAAGAVGVVIAIVLVSSRSSGGSRDRIAALEEENRQLREELNRPRDRPA